MVLALKACMSKMKAWPCAVQELQLITGINHRATLENSVCLKHPVCPCFIGWMLIHGIAKHRPDSGSGVVLALVPIRGMWNSPLVVRVLLPRWWMPDQPVGLSLNVSDGISQGGRYCDARGEILRPLHDQLQRRRSASPCPSIKNESLGSEDDQTPS